MMVYTDSEKMIIEKVKNTLVRAGSTFRNDKKEMYVKRIAEETNLHSKWVMETILQNAEVAEKNQSPLCDDTGIPHVVLEVGKTAQVTGNLMQLIQEGVKQGLRSLPGRPMAIMGNDVERLNQEGGLSSDSEDVLMAPILIRMVEEDIVRVHVLMMGGGPAIRGKTYRVFHKHDEKVVLNEIVTWSVEAAKQLGCTPCTLGIGIGRSQFEATSLMMEALIDGNYNEQSALETEITDRVNASNVGALGLQGNTTVLGTFMKIGEQRASGVRIVALRPCCCFEPRVASIEL